MAACKTFPSGDMSPALLVATSDASMSALKTAAMEVLDRKTVELGANDYANSPQISVLPNRVNSPKGAPFNQQSFAIPTQLLLMTDGTNCFLVKEDTRELAHLKGIECRSIG